MRRHGTTKTCKNCHRTLPIEQFRYHERWQRFSPSCLDCIADPYRNRSARQAAARPALFWSKVDRSGGPEACWEWQAGTTGSGYGRFKDGPRGQVMAHRFAWELTHGDIPEEMVICHRCDNPPCCNPAHLFLGTVLDNVRDKIHKGRFRYATGESAGAAKITEAAVREIRQLAEAGWLRRDIAKRFDVSVSNVGLIVTRKTWRHVK